MFLSIGGWLALWGLGCVVCPYFAFRIKVQGGVWIKLNGDSGLAQPTNFGYDPSLTWPINFGYDPNLTWPINLWVVLKLVNKVGIVGVL